MWGHVYKQCVQSGYLCPFILSEGLFVLFLVIVFVIWGGKKRVFRNYMCVCVHTQRSVWVCLFSPQLVVGIIGVGLKGGDLHSKMDCVCASLKYVGTHKIL